MVLAFLPIVLHNRLTVFQAPPKGPNHPYDPHNYDEFFAPEYGGFTMQDMRGGGRGGRGGGRGGGMRGGR